MAVRYGFQINRGNTAWIVGDCDTREEAIRECVEFALRDGWKPRKWWQFWRRDVDPMPKDYKRKETK